MTYVGELGWELYCPAEFGLRLWDLLWEAGRPHGLVAGGYRAIDSMRLEKGYRVWGSDITPDVTPVRGRAGIRGDARQGVRLHRPGCVAGARATATGRAALCLVLDDPRSVALGEEPVRVDGRSRAE